ncbi:hypothetical protein DFP72DRAFT_1176818 [Ephemerocybe angulata]|uniref:Uncharacterized protein n=1 Tax=Ephemerocybe angulata TaxID=980116 RepID=A0A8H6LUP3_9AGAR|nr:hypothetical protein DFP72DRAFT_1176818 [Tulosesus angulatus]
MRVSFINLLTALGALASLATAYRDDYTFAARDYLDELTTSKRSLDRREMLADIAIRDLLDELADRLEARAPGDQIQCSSCSMKFPGTSEGHKQINDEVEPASILLGSYHHVLVPIAPSPTTHLAVCNVGSVRHMSSSLASPTQRPHRRTAQHLRTSDVRLGSLSLISSSPIYIHTSSSASFGRDIDPLLLTSL